MKTGHKLQFECIDGFTLDGSKELTCLESGQWDAPFPTCSGTFVFDINVLNFNGVKPPVSQPRLLANVS